MTKHPVGELRNIVLVGHGAVGKTTLADLMLFKAGVGTRAGSVDDSTSLLDTDDDEKERHHSLTSHVAHFEQSGDEINLIDAPGYPDFIGQAIGAMRAAETAIIVIGATSGIEVNTRKTFQLAEKAHLGRFIVINKCDGDNIDLPGLMEVLRATFGNACSLMTVPVGIGANFSAVVDTVHLPAAIPAGCVIDPVAAGQQVMDAAVEADESLMERYLNGETLTAAELNHAISKAIVVGSLIPVFCTSAKKDIGVKELMEAMASYAPSPLDIAHAANQGGKEVDIVPQDGDPLIAQVFKTRVDPFVGKMSFVRIYSGTLKKDLVVRDERLGKSVKITQMLKVQGGKYEQISEAGPGEIVTIVKADDLKLGDTLTHGADGVNMSAIPFPTPMIGLAVSPKSHADQQKISGALHKIEEEDSTFIVKREAQTHEMVMQGMSELHLQLIKNRLLKREKVEVVTHQPKVPYRETVSGNAEGSYRHKKQSGGSGQFAEVHLRISHCPQGINPEEYFVSSRFPSLRRYHYDPVLNSAFLDRVTGGSVPNNYIPAIEKGVKERMEQGVMAGHQVQDVVVELFFGKDHPVDSNETAFKTAARMCFKEVFAKAKPNLLEPIVSLEIVIPQDKLGDITSDLNTRRGRMEGMDSAPGGFAILKARAPLAEVMTYARSLSSLTGGRGSFTLDFSHYEMVPPNEMAKIIANAKKVEEDE